MVAGWHAPDAAVAAVAAAAAAAVQRLQRACAAGDALLVLHRVATLKGQKENERGILG